MATDLREENARLRADNARLAALLTTTLNEVAKLNEPVGELLAIALRKKASPKRAPKELVAPLPLDEKARATFEERALAPELPPKPEKPKQKQRPTGRKPQPEHLPDNQHVVTPRACSCWAARSTSSTRSSRPTPRGPGAPAQTRRAPQDKSLPELQHAHDSALVARAPRGLQGHVRLAGLARL